MTKAVPCGAPDCPVCGRRRKAELMNRCGKGFRNRRSRMATLTQGPGFTVPIGKAYTRFRNLLQRPRLSKKDHQTYLDWFTKGRHKGQPKPRLRKRRHMHKARYFWVKEPHLGGGENNGNLHLHVGLDVYIPQKIIKWAWEKATNGHGEITFINDSKSGDIRDMAAYMSKYITKTLGGYYEGFKSGERRYQFSSHPEFKKEKYTPEYEVRFKFDSQKYHDGIRAKAMPGAQKLWDKLRRERHDKSQNGERVPYGTCS